MTPDEREVKKILARIEPQLLEIVNSAWDDVCKVSTSCPMDFKRTRANLMWDRMACHARTTLTEGKNLKIVDGNNTLYIVVDNRVQLRFKKADKNGLGSNIPTQRELAFTGCGQMSLPDFDDLVRIEVNYVLNPDETEIDKILVVARDGATPIWFYGLEPFQAEVAALPAPAVSEVQPRTLLHPRVKRDDNKTETTRE